MKGGAEALAEERREQQRQVCAQLLKKWVPLAASEALELADVDRKGAPIEGDAFEAGLKAGAFVVKLLERLARLDGLDAAEKKELTVGRSVDPVELARRVRVASPLLVERMEAARKAAPPGG